FDSGLPDGVGATGAAPLLGRVRAAGVNRHDPGFEPVLKMAAPVMEAAADPIRIAGGGEVRTGTASWTDPTMVAKGVFYPDDASTAEDRLRYYATRFPVVEVDATYYALPREQQSKLWVERRSEERRVGKEGGAGRSTER